VRYPNWKIVVFPGVPATHPSQVNLVGAAVQNALDRNRGISAYSNLVIRPEYQSIVWRAVIGENTRSSAILNDLITLIVIN
jgi:hypothetical protein